MARPVVLVYQEFAEATVTPDVPDLNCIVIGPAYWIKDYLDDKGDIRVSTAYGTKDENNPYIPPIASTDAVTVAEPPGNQTGALLEASSVKVFFDEARVLIAEDSDDADASTGADVTADSNVVTATGGTPIDFVATGVQPGDYLIIEDPAGGGTDLAYTVLAVDSTTSLRTTKNFTASGTDLLFRIEREVDDIEVSSAFVTVSGNQVIIEGGVTTTLTGETTPRVVNYAVVYIEYVSLRQDLRDVDTVSSETDVTTKIGKVDARNPLAGVVNTALANTTTTIQFFGVKADSSTGHNDAIEIIEGRKDIYAIVPITEDKSILAAYKTNVEGLASVHNAETNGIPQKFRVVLGAQALPTDKVLSGAYTSGSHLSVTGAIAGTPIVAADDINVFADDDADFVTAGVRAGDKLVIVSDTFGTSRVGEYVVAEVYDANRLRTTTAFPAADNTGSIQYYIVRGSGSTETTLPASFADGANSATSNAGSTVTTEFDRSLGVADEYAGKLITLGGALTTTHLIINSTAANPAVFTVAPAPASDETNISGTVTNTLLSVTAARTVATRRCFRVIQDNSATFTTDLVQATDLLQVPNPITGTDYDTVAPYEYTVAYIPNENVIILEANSDVIAQDNEAGDTDLNFRISRTLSKDDQVDELVAIAASFDSRRVVLVWPDLVDVTGLVDGSKERSGTSAEAADSQPGYYLAGVVGGLTAGLPSHQGFTNLGIAGIDEIYHSTRYFSDTQLTELSDGGWFVYEQETPNTLPSCIHQLTTDPSTLETGEYSVVKNFDFIALFFQDILDDFLGEYNINEETLGLLEQALDTGIDVLKLRRYAKIGAPINSAEVVSVEEHATIADRVEIKMNAGLPKPLNRIGLHLVSV